MVGKSSEELLLFQIMRRKSGGKVFNTLSIRAFDIKPQTSAFL